MSTTDNEKDAMSPIDEQRDALLDRAVESVRAQTPSEQELSSTGQRAWAKIEAEIGRAGQVAGSDDLEQLIPAYLDGELDAGQVMLVEDRIGSDAAFRAAVTAARSGAPRRRRPADRPVALPAAAARPAWHSRASWAVAAAVVLVAGLSTWWAGQDLLMPNRVLAHVETVEGSLVHVDDHGASAVAVGDAITPGQRLRATRDGGAVLTLDDGSRIELDARAELALRTRGDGTIVDLERGNIVIEAAPQGRGRLRVATDDANVTVRGTIFAVRHGTKGSRVSVIEGEVGVASGRQRARLLPGQQFASSPLVGAVPVFQDVAWSQNAERYEEILSALVEIGREIDETVTRPGPRSTSRLAAAAPADTVVFVSLPNLGATFAESWILFRERVSENPVLATWWAERMDDPQTEQRINTLVEAMGRLGGEVGDEVAIALTLDADGQPALPVVFAEVADAAAFRQVVEAEWNNFATLADEGDLPPMTFLDDPAAFVAEHAVIEPNPGADVDAAIGTESTLDAEGADVTADVENNGVADDGMDNVNTADADGNAPFVGLHDNGIDEALYVWLGNGIVGVSPMAASLVPLAASAAGGATMDEDLLTGIAQAMAGGADALFAADVGRVFESHVIDEVIGDAGMNGYEDDNESQDGSDNDGNPNAQGREAIEASGLAGIGHVIVTQTERDGRAELEATVGFDGARKGLASWLAAPAPMGALGFISTDATLVSAAVIERPEVIVAQLLDLAQGIHGMPMDGEDVDHDMVMHMELLRALAAPLGGEVAFALDGPVLPEPSWKLIVEVYDDAALQNAVADTVERINERIAAEELERGDAMPEPLRGRRLSLSAEEVGGRTIWSIAADGAEVFSMHYAVLDGYLVASSNPALIGEAARVRESGLDITTDPAFRAGLPSGGDVDFSAIVWQDLGGLLGGAAAVADEAMASRGAEMGLATSLAPSLLVAWADSDRIRVRGASAASALDFGTILGAGGLFGLDSSDLPLPSDWDAMGDPLMLEGAFDADAASEGK